MSEQTPDPTSEEARDPQTGRLPFGQNPATPVGPGGTGDENPAQED